MASSPSTSPFLLSFATPSSLPPSGTHLLLTSTPPSPPHLYAAQLAASFLAHSASASASSSATPPQRPRRVLWLECNARPHEHIRRLVRRAGAPATAAADAALTVRDATAAVVLAPAAPSTTSAAAPTDAEEALRPLDALLVLVRAELAAAGTQMQGKGREGEGEGEGEEAQCLVVLDDFSALAWALEPPASSAAETHARVPHGVSVGALPTKAKGKTRKAPLEPWAGALARWLEELRLVCASHNAVLLTHLHAEHTSVLSRAAAPQRGGKGEGFDADDAGEEDLDGAVEGDVFDTELPLSSHAAPEAVLAQDEEGELIKPTASSSSRERERPRPEADYVDALDDGLLRATLPTADVWIEQRALRSGQADDCHGEICMHRLLRPSAAIHLPLPTLPLPGSHDPFRAARRAWRAAHPSPSPASSPSSSSSSAAAASASSASAAPLRALASLALQRERAPPPKSFAVRSAASGRGEAVLFEVREGRTRVEVRTWRRAGGNA